MYTNKKKNTYKKEVLIKTENESKGKAGLRRAI